MIKFEKRSTVNSVTAVLVGVIAVLLGLLLSIIILTMIGYDAVAIYKSAFGATFLSTNGILEVMVTWIPVALCSLAVAVSASAGLWNIGIEAQFYIGAFAATGIALFVNAPPIIELPLMFLAGAVAGGIVGVVITLPKHYWNISEILTSILLNNIAFQFILYITSDAWKDPSTGAIQTPVFEANAKLPILIPGSRVHIGFLLTIIILVLVWYVISYRPLGFELRAVGENVKASKYAGMEVTKIIFLAMFISGCIAGVAGMFEVSGVAHRLQIAVHNGYGFAGFILAWIARLNTFAIAVVGFFFAGIIVSGFRMQMMGLPSSIVLMLQGLIMILCIAGELLTYYKITFVKKSVSTDEAVEIN